MQPSRTQRYLELLLCLPKAPALPRAENGDFGTSPIYGQLSHKPLLVACILSILTWWDVKHNRDRELNRQAASCRPAGLRLPWIRSSAAATRKPLWASSLLTCEKNGSLPPAGFPVRGSRIFSRGVTSAGSLNPIRALPSSTRRQNR